jgi:hypothetical protein
VAPPGGTFLTLGEGGRRTEALPMPDWTDLLRGRSFNDVYTKGVMLRWMRCSVHAST